MGIYQIRDIDFDGIIKIYGEAQEPTSWPKTKAELIREKIDRSITQNMKYIFIRKY